MCCFVWCNEIHYMFFFFLEKDENESKDSLEESSLSTSVRYDNGAVEMVSMQPKASGQNSMFDFVFCILFCVFGFVFFFIFVVHVIEKRFCVSLFKY